MLETGPLYPTGPTRRYELFFQKNKNKKRESISADRPSGLTYFGGGLNQREPPVLPGSPSPRTSANILFLPTSCALEEQCQSHRSHIGGKLGGKRGIGSIG